MDKKEFLINEMNKLNLSLSDHQVNQFLSYYDILVEWNSFMNLTAITDFEDVVIKHFVDSVSLLKMLDFSIYSNVIDVGTGAGFPGIPLKILYPDSEITLLDSLQKRINFLNHVIESLGLKKIKTIHGRAEDYAKPNQLRESFDLCVSRAVANLSSLTELCLPFVRVGGKFVSYKSEKVSDELRTAQKTIQILGGELSCKKEFYLNSNNIYRSFVMITKVKNTPKSYPRKSGLAVKSPIS